MTFPSDLSNSQLVKILRAYTAKPDCAYRPELAEAARRLEAGVTPEHHPACNYWSQPLGYPGCICVVVNKNDLRRAAEATPETLNFAYAMTLLIAASKSGDPGSLRLAAQLAGAAPCPTCDFVNYKCKCERPSVQQEVLHSIRNLKEGEKLLKPCPFCAEDLDMEVDNSDTNASTWVICHGCGSRGAIMKDCASAIRYWNTRGGVL